MEKEEIAPGIFVYKNVIKDYSFLIDEIEESVARNVIEWEQASVKTYAEKASIDKSIRDTSGIWVPYSRNPKLNLSSPKDSFLTSLSKIFFDSFNPVEQDYKNHFGVVTVSHDYFNILKYGIGQKFTNHIDDGQDYHRRVSTVYYLNENYEGGEIEFPRFGVLYKPKANEMLVFPSTYTYNHSVKEVTSGTRYAVVSWMK